MKREYYTFQTICRDCAKNGQILEPYLADEDGTRKGFFDNEAEE